MSNAYIIMKDTIIACIDTDLKNGTWIDFSFNKSKNAIDANRDYDLVNSKCGIISRAKKYDRDRDSHTFFGTEINPKEFYVESVHD